MDHGSPRGRTAAEPSHTALSGSGCHPAVTVARRDGVWAGWAYAHDEGPNQERPDRMSFSDDPRRAAMPRPKDRVLSTETVGDPEADDPKAAGQEGAAAGAVAGALVGGPIGAVAGAVVGGAAGTAGETADEPADERRHDTAAHDRDHRLTADKEDRR